jgi:predicted ATP-dependent protease
VSLVQDLLRECDYWARQKNLTVIDRAVIETSLYEKNERISLIERHIEEDILNGEIMISTEGKVVGQINGLEGRIFSTRILIISV